MINFSVVARLSYSRGDLFLVCRGCKLHSLAMA